MSTSTIQNGVTSDVEASLPKSAPRVAAGEYQIIAWDLSLTGPRIIDEMCLITASVVPEGKSFSQYVMPYRKPDPTSQRLHGFAISTMGRFRALRDIDTGKILRTKSEFSALTDFLVWLEKNRGKDGVLLLSYEPRTLIPHILIEALRRYSLVDKFCAIVKGFVNGFTVAEAKYLKPVNSLSLRNLTRILLHKDAEIMKAVEISHAIFEVVKALCDKAEDPGSDDSKTAPTSVAVTLCEFAVTISQEEENLVQMKGLLERQLTLRPVFGPMIQKNRRFRQNASVQKQLLAEAGLDYPQLSEAFKANGKDGLAVLMKDKLTNVSSKVCEELLNLMVDHFDPPPKELITTPDKDSNEGKVPVAKENGEKVLGKKHIGEGKEHKAMNGERRGENDSVKKQNGEQRGKKVTIAKESYEQKRENVIVSKQNGEQNGDKGAKQNGLPKGEGDRVPLANQNGDQKGGVDAHMLASDKQNGVHNGGKDDISIVKLNGEQKGGGDTVPKQNGEGDTVPKQNGEGDLVPKQNVEGDIVPKQNGDGCTVPKQNGEGDTVAKQNGEGGTVPKQNGEGDTVPKQNGEGDMVSKLNGGSNRGDGEKTCVANQNGDVIKELPANTLNGCSLEQQTSSCVEGNANIQGNPEITKKSVDTSTE